MRRQKLDPKLKEKLRKAKVIRETKPSLGLRTRIRNSEENRPTSLDPPGTKRDALD